MKTIYLIFAFWLLGTLSGSSQSDTICLTDREYNYLLVRTNCTEIIKADSTLLWDKQREINLQSEFVAGQKEVISITEKQLKKTKRQVFKYKVGMWTAIVAGVVSNVYLIFH